MFKFRLKYAYFVVATFSYVILIYVHESTLMYIMHLLTYKYALFGVISSLILQYFYAVVHLQMPIS